MKSYLRGLNRRPMNIFEVACLAAFAAAALVSAWWLLLAVPLAVVIWANA